MKLLLRFNAKAVINRWWPSLEWAVEHDLFTADEAAQLLADLTIDAVIDTVVDTAIADTVRNILNGSV